MRVVFQAAAMTSIVISVLILVVLVRGAINFMRLIDWDSRPAHRHRLVPPA